MKKSVFSEELCSFLFPISEVHFITKLWHTREVCFECALKYSFQDMLEKKKLLQSARNFGKILILDLENTVWSFYQGYHYG